MKLKSLLFGSAAVLAAGTGAQAADLPTAEPVEYVRICDAFGTGFYYIPGTDTCLRISGRVRIEGAFVDDFDDDSSSVDREFNNYTTRARANLRVDARTQTDMGLIRAFFEYQVQVGHGGAFGHDDNHNYGDPEVDLSSAFIQISNDAGTFTAGHTSSFFDFWGSNTFGSRVGIDDNTTEQTMFAYTFAAGNGFSATISFEDFASAGRRHAGGCVVADLSGLFPAATCSDNYEGQEWPDLVGNIRIDQGWGSAQIMGALHHIHDKDGADIIVAAPPGGSEGEDDDDELGWAIGAGASIKLGTMFQIDAEAGYADGALGYISNDPGGAGDFSTTCVINAAGTATSCDNDTNNAWMIRAGLTGKFSPTVSAHLDGSFTSVNDEGASDNDYDLWAVAANVVWEPVSGLQIGPEVAYNNIDFDGPADNSDIWSLMWRIQRDF
jgi:hypothetical protein